MLISIPFSYLISLPDSLANIAFENKLMLMLNKYGDSYSNFSLLGVTELKLTRRESTLQKRKVRLRPNEDTVEQEPSHFTYWLYCIVFLRTINLRLHD